MPTRNYPIFRLCEVLSIDDEQEGGRIKARVIPVDNRVENVDEIMYAFPALPKMFHIRPKVGEAVIIITAFADDGLSQRYYFGPVISQLNHLEKDSFNFGALSLFDGAYYPPDAAPSQNPETHGAYPSEEDVAVLGRRNADIIITDNDVRVRAGVKKADMSDRTNLKFNKKDPAYLKLKYHEDKGEDAEYKSTATLVADKINLIGNNAKDYFNTTDKDELVSDKTMDDIIEKAHQLPYGDILIDFLKILRNEVMTHTHPYPTMPPCSTATMQHLGEYNLEKILSDSVRIN